MDRGVNGYDTAKGYYSDIRKKVLTANIVDDLTDFEKVLEGAECKSDTYALSTKSLQPTTRPTK
jgi:hypothetical protein